MKLVERGLGSTRRVGGGDAASCKHFDPCISHLYPVPGPLASLVHASHDETTERHQRPLNESVTVCDSPGAGKEVTVSA